MDRGVSVLGRYMDLTLQMECRFSHRLDLDRLARAADLCRVAEPVLGCRYDRSEPRAFWARLDSAPGSLLRCVTDESAFEQARRDMIDPYHNPQLQLVHVPASGGDRLLVKVHHLAADAGGTKEAVELLAGIYSRLKNDPGYRPEPNLAGSRNIDQITRCIPAWAWPRIFLNYCAEIWRKMVPLRSHALMADDNGRAEQSAVCGPLELRELSAERVTRMRKLATPVGATLNDMLIAAFLRAQVATVPWDGRAILRLFTTVDHRLNTLPTGRGESLGNLSAFEFYRLGRTLGGDLAETLKRVVARTRRRKASWFGMNSYLLETRLVNWLDDAKLIEKGEEMVGAAGRMGNIANALTNMGPIEERQVTFDQPAESAFLIAPPARRLLVLAGVSGYRGRLTLSGGAPENLHHGATTKALFDNLLAELPD